VRAVQIKEQQQGSVQTELDSSSKLHNYVQATGTKFESFVVEVK